MTDELYEEDNEKTTLDFFTGYVDELPVLTEDEVNELLDNVRNGDEKARDKIVMAHLKTVCNIATEFTDRGLETVDLLSQGINALYRAVDTYKSQWSCSFAKYAAWMIMMDIRRELCRVHYRVTIPANMVAPVHKVLTAARELLAELQREPTDEEISEKLGMPVDEVKVIMQHVRETANMKLCDDSDLIELHAT